MPRTCYYASSQPSSNAGTVTERTAYLIDTGISARNCSRSSPFCDCGYRVQKSKGWIVYRSEFASWGHNLEIAIYLYFWLLMHALLLVF